MKIGIRAGCLRQDWFPALETAGALGFDSMEPDVGPDPSGIPLWSADGRRDLVAACEKTGVALSSLCIGGLWAVSPASADAETRQRARDLITNTTRYSAEVGVRWILLPITPGSRDEDPETAACRWIEEMTALAPVAEENGIVFCLENVGGGCGKTAAHLRRLVEGVGSPAVRVYYDIGNAVLFKQDPAREIADLGDMIRIVHIKDHAPRLGDGDVPVAASLRALRGIGYDGSLVFETDATDDPARAATYNLGYLNGVLASVY